MTTKFDANGCVLAPSVTGKQIQTFRLKLGMSQEQFAVAFDIPVGTLRDWEQIDRRSLARDLFVRLLRLIQKEPRKPPVRAAKASTEKTGRSFKRAPKNVISSTNASRELEVA